MSAEHKEEVKQVSIEPLRSPPPPALSAVHRPPVPPDVHTVNDGRLRFVNVRHFLAKYTILDSAHSRSVYGAAAKLSWALKSCMHKESGEMYQTYFLMVPVLAALPDTVFTVPKRKVMLALRRILKHREHPNDVWKAFVSLEYGKQFRCAQLLDTASRLGYFSVNELFRQGLGLSVCRGDGWRQLFRHLFPNAIGTTELRELLLAHNSRSALLPVLPPARWDTDRHLFVELDTLIPALQRFPVMTRWAIDYAHFMAHRLQNPPIRVCHDCADRDAAIAILEKRLGDVANVLQ